MIGKFHRDPGSQALIAEESLYVTRDGRVVSGGDPEAHAVLCTKGQLISPKKIERYGLKADLEDTDPPQSEMGEIKESRPSETKVLYPSETKRKKH